MADLKKKSASGTVVYLFFLLLYIFIIGAGIFYGLGKLWTFAGEYENAIPTKVMDVYIADLNENLLDDTVLQTIENMPHPYQTNEEVATLVQQMFSSELTYARTVGGDGENSIVYAILCDGNAIGRVTIVRDQSKAAETEFGNLPWVIQSEEFDFSNLYSSMQITVPQSYSVSLNGHILAGENLIGPRVSPTMFWRNTTRIIPICRRRSPIVRIISLAVSSRSCMTIRATSRRSTRTGTIRSSSARSTRTSTSVWSTLRLRFPIRTSPIAPTWSTRTPAMPMWRTSCIPTATWPNV